MAGKGGGAWKVAYADFVTAMMAFFLVMWITAQNKPVKQAIARYFDDPFGAEEGAATTPRLGEDGAKSLGPYDIGWGRSGWDSDSPPVSIAEPSETADGQRRRAVVYDLPDDTRRGTMLLFADSGIDLDEAAQRQLITLLPDLLGKPNMLEIRGHTSPRPLPADGPFDSPWQLSYERCMATMEFLIANGIEPHRIRLSQAGGYEPFTLRRDPLWQQKNSRVEVYVLSEFAASREQQRDAANSGS